MSNKRFQLGKTSEPTHKIGDKSRLLWERYYGPMQGAANVLNAAINNTMSVIGGVIIEMEGFSVDTHIFNADKMEIVPRPQEIKQ